MGLVWPGTAAATFVTRKEANLKLSQRGAANSDTRCPMGSELRMRPGPERPLPAASVSESRRTQPAHLPLGTEHLASVSFSVVVFLQGSLRRGGAGVGEGSYK